MNRPKAKGTWGETHAVKWFRENGFPGADRKALKGNKDCGDLDLCPGVVAEVKNVKLATGVPAKGQLTEWMRQAEVERQNAGAAYCILIVKRPGTQDVGQWFAYLPLNQIQDLVCGHQLDDPRSPVMMSVSDMAWLFRECGYGTDPLYGVGNE